MKTKTAWKIPGRFHLAGTCENRTHPSTRKRRSNGFEDRGGHQAPIHSRDRHGDAGFDRLASTGSASHFLQTGSGQVCRAQQAREKYCRAFSTAWQRQRIVFAAVIKMELKKSRGTLQIAQHILQSFPFADRHSRITRAVMQLQRRQSIRKIHWRTPQQFPPHLCQR